ncbi:MAG: response regulator transcription factor [Pseudohongiella sp.]|nr:response regulator transcription factor [Pseudohongiella sp.]MDO9520195.1 response regulator transcription factor [Pseudohongiella sp.]MDP2125932.1 response regulator transcription factor [Pseudohongiella sp.]
MNSDTTQQITQRVLLIEDDEVFSGVVSRALGRRGYQVHTVNNIEAARSAVSSMQIDCAIVDLNLAGHSSLELIPGLRSQNPDARILMLTGYASIATAVEAIKLGADNYLAKPADIDDILAALSAESENIAPESPFHEPMSVRRLEWEHIQKILMENDGNISETARQLKMHRRTLQRKLQKKPVAG